MKISLKDSNRKHLGLLAFFVILTQKIIVSLGSKSFFLSKNLKRRSMLFIQKKHYFKLFIALLLNFSVIAQAKNIGLMIIDMQPIFNSKNIELGNNKQIFDRVVQNQISLIQLAIIKQIPIFIVEYRGFGETDPRLISATENYPQKYTILKDVDGLFSRFNDSRDSTLELLRELEISNLIIAGANGSSCVAQTIFEGITEGFKITTWPAAIVDFNSSKFIFPYRYSAGHVSVTRIIMSQIQELETLELIEELLNKE